MGKFDQHLSNNDYLGLGPHIDNIYNDHYIYGGILNPHFYIFPLKTQLGTFYNHNSCSFNIHGVESKRFNLKRF